MVEADDAYTGQHSREVLELSLAVADALRLDHHSRRNVEFGALLHDVGKVAIPKSMIGKEGPLDDQEWAIVKTHTVEGQQLLDRMGGVMSGIGRVVRSSHERWDGRGYPDGLCSARHPPGVADHLGVRHVQRHDHDVLVPPRAVPRRGRRRAAPLRGLPAGPRRGARAAGAGGARRARVRDVCAAS